MTDMAHQGKDRDRRLLSREVTGTVAVLADERDFATMRRYRSFPIFGDHAAYLRQMERLLRTRTARGAHTSVALFDPAGYEEFCAEEHLDPDTPASRNRYTAEVAAAGTTVAYEGQPIRRLLPRLVDETAQQATWEYASDLIARSGGCTSCGEDVGQAAFVRATRALRRIVEAFGWGRHHHLVCTVPGPGGVPLVGVLDVDVDACGTVELGEADALVFCTVVAAGLTVERSGAIVVRTLAHGAETVCGWGMADGTLRPLTEGEVFAAYCTDIVTGEPVPPEHGVEYREAPEIDLE
ncbi:hypothetical protein ACMATS_32035 [Streptoverticillium reticulum]|uniref:hypothetical protein n=1 Tax=Streptoverticillium reticulum TaxID=1433415 RepID=UPI0039BF18AE